MLDKETVKKRAMKLSEPLCDRETFIRIYGIDIWDYNFYEVFKMFEAYNYWCKKHVEDHENLMDSCINRYDFALFCNIHGFITTPQSAIKLGMEYSSFLNLLEGLKSRHLLPKKFCPLNGFCWSEELKKIPKIFGIRELFGVSHDEEIETFLKFHKIIMEWLEIDISTVRCADCDKEGQLSVAHYFDAITSQPVCNKHTVWMKCPNVMALVPDICSESTSIIYRDVLKHYLYI